VQDSVAKAMAVVGMEKFIDFVVSTGDNFLDSGLTSVYDRQFKDSFMDVYKSPALQVRGAPSGSRSARRWPVLGVGPETRPCTHRQACIRSVCKWLTLQRAQRILLSLVGLFLYLGLQSKRVILKWVVAHCRCCSVHSM
jgi:hypothetical protein